MHDWYSRNAGWQGTAADLAEQARALLQTLDGGDDPVLPNERLVRHYVQLGILGKPVRNGKEAYFGARQVVEYLVARKLAGEGWPLAKIAEFNQTHGLDSLLALLPPSRAKTPAEELVAQFRRASAKGPAARATADAAAASPFLDHSAAWAQHKTTARELLRSLGQPAGEPQRTELVRLTLTPWCELLIDPAGLKAVSPDTLEALGEAIAHLLRETLQSPRRPSS